MLKIALHIEPGVIDYNVSVASVIVNKLSFDMDTIETWNVDQAPNEKQLRQFVKQNKKSLLANMTQNQRENLFKWVLKGELYAD